MRAVNRLVAAAIAIGLSMTAQAMSPGQGQASIQRAVPVSVIFDTDMWGDIDDALALGMLHALQDRHEVEMLAIVSSTADPNTISYIDVMNSFYGHPGIPLGQVGKGVTGREFKSGGDVNYTQAIVERRDPDGKLFYPRRVTDGSKAEAAVALLRKTLAAQPDRSVVYVLVGFSTNAARLLESRPDAISPLSGIELVKRKVRLMSVMAGNFNDSVIDGHQIPKGSREFNLMFDVPSAQTVFSKWPTPIIVSGFEIGLTMLFKGEDINTKFSFENHHPLAETYRYTDPIYRGKNVAAGKLHDHPTFDLTSVLYAARPDDGYFSLSPPGDVTVLPDGATRFEERSNGNARFLIMNDVQRARALEAMTLLSTQPPIRKRGVEAALA